MKEDYAREDFRGDVTGMKKIISSRLENKHIVGHVLWFLFCVPKCKSLKIHGIMNIIARNLFTHTISWHTSFIYICYLFLYFCIFL